MKFKTAEEFVMNALDEAIKENESLKIRIAELESEPQNIDEDNPRVYRIDEPIELCTLSMKSNWCYGASDSSIKDMTAAEIRETIETREGLVGIANKEIGSEQILYVRRAVLPYQIKSLGYTVALDVHSRWNKKGIDAYTYPVCDPEKLNTSGWFPIESADGLYELGLTKLKAELERYAEKLEEKENADA